MQQKEPIDRILVIHEFTCPFCEGSGREYNWMWKEANAAYDSYHNAALEAGEERAAASDAGWNALTAYFKEQGCGSEPARWPPEELVCPECEGDRIIRKEIELSEALKAIEPKED